MSIHTIEVVIGLLVALATLALAAPKISVPLPVLLVFCGLALGFVPGLPAVELDPELVFLFFLPPLVFWAAFFISWRHFRRHLRAIASLAIGLVLFTTFAVAGAAHWAIGGMTWPAAFALGAIVSPTDAVAVSALFRRFGVPHRTLTILEGESLVNDATGLVLYQVAVIAAVTGVFSLRETLVDFAVLGAGGTLVGLAAAWLLSEIRYRLNNAPVEITLSLLTPFGAYLLAERLHVSGILAVAAAGLYTGWRAPEIASPQTRLQNFAVWQTIDFLLTGLAFILIGLQLPLVLATALDRHRLPDLISHALAISVIVIGVRLLWVFLAAYLWGKLGPPFHGGGTGSSWRQRLLVGWSGMRGVVSLAAALALPLTTRHGTPFPERDVIIFLTFGVILATLAVQGLTLPALMRWLSPADGGVPERYETEARLKTAHAAIARIESMAAEEDLPEGVADRLRTQYEERIRRYTARLSPPEEDGLDHLDAVYEQAQREAFLAERLEVIRLWKEGELTSQMFHRIERELDLAESRLPQVVSYIGKARA